MSNCNVDVSETKVDKTALKECAKDLLRKGLSKQEAFEQLKKEYHHTKLISKILRCIPTQKQKDQSKWLNRMLFLSLLPPFIIFLVESQWIISIIFIFFFFSIIKVKPKIYIGITALSFIFIISSISTFFWEESTIYTLELFILLLSMLTSLVLSYYLNDKLCPRGKDQREKYLDKQGITRTRINYTFPE